MILIILGLVGSGKGTQAELIAKKFGFEYIVMSDLLRNEINKQTEIGKKIDELIKKGQLVSDEITINILNNALLAIPQKKNVILDGYPRTIAQAENLSKTLEKTNRNNVVALHVKISEEEAMKRLSGRLVCSKCKTTHFPQDKKCRKCGAELVRRPDDMPEKIKTRLAWSKKEVGSVIEYYKNSGKLLEVNGERTVEEVNKDVVGKLKNYL